MITQNSKQENSNRRAIVTRDFFVAHALAALVQVHGLSAADHAEDIAKDAFIIADAILKEREK